MRGASSQIINSGKKTLIQSWQEVWSSVEGTNIYNAFTYLYNMWSSRLKACDDTTISSPALAIRYLRREHNYNEQTWRFVNTAYYFYLRALKLQGYIAWSVKTAQPLAKRFGNDTGSQRISSKILFSFLDYNYRIFLLRITLLTLRLMYFMK